MSYDIREHRHRFAVWAAASAVRRGFKNITTARVQSAIESSTLPQWVCSRTNWPTEAAKVDRLHEEWVDQILTQLERDGVFNGPGAARMEESYGRAAKIVAVYLKTCLLMCPDDDHQFLSLIHPPIDRILLLGLRKSPNLSRYRSRWKANWTQLKKQQYLELIASFREAGLDIPSFWAIERYWHPSGGGT